VRAAPDVRGAVIRTRESGRDLMSRFETED